MTDTITAKRTSTGLLLAAALAVALVGGALARGWQPGIPGEWVWESSNLPVHLLPVIATAACLLAVGAVLCGGGRWERLTPRRKAFGLVALIACTFTTQVALLNSVGQPWVTPATYILSPNTTTYFQVSLDIHTPGNWVRNYDATLLTLPYHAATHPPGLPLFFWGVRKASGIMQPPTIPLLLVIVQLADTLGMSITPADAAAALASALLLSFFGACVIIPTYFVTRVMADERTGLYAACLVASMPGLLILGASPDLLLMTLAAAVMCRAYAGYQGSVLSAALSGVALAIGLFLSLGLAAVAGWTLLWALWGLLRQPERRANARALGRAAILAGLVFIGAYAVLYLVWGYQPIAVAREALGAHHGVTTVETTRTYWKWVLMNPVECMLFSGVALVIACAWAIPALRGEDMTRFRGFLISWIALFAIINLSGTVRGEVGRIWLFLLWPVAIAAAAGLARRRDGARMVPLLVFLQVAQVVMMKGYLTIYSIL